jgi:phenylalanine-4-hydroxylase
MQKDNEMKRPTRQIYSDYTAEDLHVWQTLYDRQIPHLRDYACAAYLRALDTVGFCAERIPDFSVLDAVLLPLTGWSIQVVPNISVARDFFGHLAQRRFTATCWVRTMAQLDYIEEPDMCHDVFAHIPLISDPDYCRFLEGLGHLAADYSDIPEALELVGRFYWFTIEFGLIREQDTLKIYGAGIMSSSGETMHCMTGDCERRDYDIAAIISTPYRNDIIQDTYYIIDSFDQLYRSLPDVRQLIEQQQLAKVSMDSEKI